MIQFWQKYYSKLLLWFFFVITCLVAQTHIPADPFYLLQYEKAQFEGRFPMKSNVFRPIYYNTDSTAFSFTMRSEGYYNTNAPNQENMDVRYFSNGVGNFNSFQLAFNSPYFSFMAEPYIMRTNFLPVKGIDRKGSFSVLNDRPLTSSQKPATSGLRNLLTFIHYKGIGFGWHNGNRWWGPGIHTSFQMTNNTKSFMGNIIGTIQEIRIGPIGIFGLYTFARLNEKTGSEAEYFTSLNGQITWYGDFNLSLGFSRNYLTGGANISSYTWTKKDAKNIVFEGLLTSNLLDNEYTVGGHDLWDQTLSGYGVITFPKRNLKVYTEIGFNDNRMYFADFLSQPDHSMATIFGIRDYGIGKQKNMIWGFEVTNLMITYSSRHRPTGPGTWYYRDQYDYSSYKGRRWGAHSGSDSDDWYFYVGYISDKLMVVPALNYERHGIVSHRPAEVKIEFRLDTRYKYKDTWFGIYYEKQFEAFLGFPDHFYVNDLGEPVDASEGKFANSRLTNTLILSLSKTFNF